MLSKFRLNAILLVCAGLVLGLLFQPAISIISAHGGDTSLVHGCVRPISGLLRIIGANDTCGTNETALDWSQFGSSGGSSFGDFRSDQLTNTNFNNELSAWAFRNFDGANFLGSSFSDSLGLDSSTFVNANFTNAYFDITADNTDFTGADFTDATFEGTSGEPTVFENTNFTDANFTNTTFTFVDLSSATVTGATWDNTTCPDGTNSDNNANTCEGHLAP
jgi:uncharacterized protein YjbI with pentapeptide repeats